MSAAHFVSPALSVSRLFNRRRRESRSVLLRSVPDRSAMHGERASKNKHHYDYGSDDVVNILATYLPSNVFAVDEEKLMLTSHLINFFSTTPPGQDLASQVKDDNRAYFLSVDFQQFRKICELEEFYATLEEKPRVALACMCAAVHKVFLRKCEDSLLDDGMKINNCLHSYPESMIALKNLKAAYINFQPNQIFFSSHRFSENKTTGITKI